MLGRKHIVIITSLFIMFALSILETALITTPSFGSEEIKDVIEILTYNISLGGPGTYLVLLTYNISNYPFILPINDSYHIIVKSNNVTLPYYVGYFDPDNKTFDLFVLINTTRDYALINVTYDLRNAYNYTIYGDKVFNLFLSDFRVSNISTTQWKIINGSPGNATIEKTNDYLCLFMNITQDNLLGIVLKKALKPPFHIYAIADLSNIKFIKEHKYIKEIDSVFALLDNDNPPSHFVPYLNEISEGYFFESMDWIWPYIRYTVDGVLMDKPPAVIVNNSPALLIYGKIRFFGKITSNGATWDLINNVNHTVINWTSSRSLEFYPAFILKGNFAYPSMIKAYMIGAFNYTLITNNIKLVSHRFIVISKSVTTSTIVSTTTITITSSITKTVPITTTVTHTSTKTISKIISTTITTHKTETETKTTVHTTTITNTETKSLIRQINTTMSVTKTFYTTVGKTATITSTHTITKTVNKTKIITPTMTLSYSSITGTTSQNIRSTSYYKLMLSKPMHKISMSTWVMIAIFTFALLIAGILLGFFRYGKH